MRLQLLVSTMNQTDSRLIKKMNISSDALFINQCDRFERQIFQDRGGVMEWYSFPERGIGKSRNSALIRASGDILLFADDDVTYRDGYSDIVISEFNRLKQADIIIFNVPSSNPERAEFFNIRTKRLRFYNCLRYGTFRIAIRKTAIQRKRLCFSQLFGGGCCYGSGEDSIFLMDCIRKGLRLYASPEVIGSVSHAESSWFSGYTEKFFYDKGALFAGISDHFAYALSLQFCLRHREMMTTLSLPTAYKIMKKGIDHFRKGN